MKCLVSYVYYETPQSKFNLEYFIKNGIYESNNVQFVIIINGFTCSLELPEYPNLKIIKRENTGYDFGGHSIVLEEYNYFNYYIFMNSSVIGPILPVYYKDEWPQIFIGQFTKDIKLVGTSIVCLPDTDAGGYGPRVEGFCFALDSKGLDIVKNAKTVFTIHNDKYSAIVNGEYGLSRSILDAGYNIDCLLLKYKGINWRNKKYWNINNNMHPSRNGTYGGISINPMEVVFHKWYWSNDPVNPVSFDLVSKYKEWSFSIEE